MVIKCITLLLVCGALLHLATAKDSIESSNCVTIKQEGVIDDESIIETINADLNSGVKRITVGLINPPRRGVHVVGMSVLLCDPEDEVVADWKPDTDEVIISRASHYTLPTIRLTVRSILKPLVALE